MTDLHILSGDTRPVAPDLYGLFFEDINRCPREGTGEWAERVPYTPVPGWYASDAEMTVDTRDTLNPRREAALKVSFRPGGFIRNIGFHNIPATKGKAMLLWIRRSGDVS